MPHPQYKGQNLPVYSICPNWKTPLSLRTIYSTIVRETLDLTEERNARFPRSLFGLRYTTLPLDGQETGYIRRVMELAQALPVIMPVWTDACKLTVAAAPGNLILTVDDTYPTLFSVLYDYVILWKDYKSFEVLATTGAESIDDNAISLADAVVGNYPVGSLAMPILIGKLARPQARALTDEHGVHALEFEERFHGLTDQSVVEEYTELDPLVVGYTDECRAEFTITESELEEDAIYAIEITDDPDDEESWATHIYFMLQGEDEILSGEKVITVNNDYNGEAFFRTVQIKNADGEDEYIVRSLAGQPEASVVAPPDLTLSNLTEISTAVQVAGAGTGGNGLRPLDFYSDGGWILPYSYIEDPMIQTSLHYRRFKRKYGWRQHASWNTGGSLTAPTAGSGHIQVVSTSGPAGATIKWTRDGSDPTLATPAPLTYQGTANNAYVSDHTFGGIIKARCFKDGCRSPLTMVAIDKVMWELPLITTFGPSKAVSGYCDLPSGSPPSETANGCTLLWGGPSGFEAHMHDIGHSGGAEANSKDNTNGPLLRRVTLSAAGTTYIGLPIWSVSAGHFEHSYSTWPNNVNGDFNGWVVAPPTHNWATTNIGTIEYEHGISMVGVAANRLAFAAHRDLFIADHLDGIAHSENYELRLSRYDVVRSPLPYQEPRDVYWATPDDGGIIDLPFDPDPEPESAVPHDKFETYADDDAADVTMDYRTGTDWDAAWAVIDGPTGLYGFDLFSDYADGAVPDYDPALNTDPTFTALDGGEAWWLDPETVFGDEWVVKTPIEGTVFKDTFATYPDGESSGFGFNDGTGWDDDWLFGGDLIGGNEKWTGYADGAFVGAATGTNWMAQNWVAV